MKNLTKIELTVTLILTFIVIIDIICICLYDFKNDQGNIIFKLIFQGSISGIITLGGLLFTSFKQEQEKRIPFLIILQNGKANARHMYSDFEEDCIDCCDPDTEYVRKVNVKIQNTKSNWAINCSICNTPIGSLDGINPINIVLLLPDNCESKKIFTITYQDSFGKKYSQKIIIQKGSSECDYVFVSSQAR